MSAQFDRQIILWGAEGQEAFEKASIWLFGSDSLACEIAKGLLLTNASQLSLIDNATISEQELKGNFLFSMDDSLVGKDRATEVAKRLSQFSSSCRLKVHSKAPEMNSSETKPSLVILANQWERPVDGEIPSNTLVIEAFTWGFWAFIRTSPLGFPIWVSDGANNDASREFWRNCQFPAFERLCKDQIQLRGASSPSIFRAYSHEHLNVPLDSESQRMARLIAAFKTSRIPQNVENALAKIELAPLEHQPMLRSLKAFVTKHSRLPAIPSLIPDLEMETEDYLKIVACFQEQFQEDLKEFPPECSENWLKKCPFIHLLQVVDGSDQQASPPTGVMLFDATAKFLAEYRKLPGCSEELREIDEMHFNALMPKDNSLAITSEWIACANVQMPCTCTVAGGIVCEQAVKLTSKVFIPNLKHKLFVDLLEGISLA